ncbi:predicted protein [Chaetomium globosum CBS 148.51]|uniref:Uncharacterized protein n=1 Tax=Chaetomium globosum (strain ATCC 6205 / CBS 148.51 / DSM 1962 / NBRC 6347 / NRRL 1970) TaxID=306901 RepID=Q2GTL7_CHAGB|nr:uncharacterized protein CHGG_08687 [Chaetomium globosum CBS 148.51]EAQ84673.1 predicted protein [Chaetomium globosum CBS 148.51]
MQDQVRERTGGLEEKDENDSAVASARSQRKPAGRSPAGSTRQTSHHDVAILEAGAPRPAVPMMLVSDGRRYNAPNPHAAGSAIKPSTSFAGSVLDKPTNTGKTTLLGAASRTVWLRWQAGLVGTRAVFSATVAAVVLRVDIAACSRLIHSRSVRANGNPARKVENNMMAGHRESRGG